VIRQHLEIHPCLVEVSDARLHVPEARLVDPEEEALEAEALEPARVALQADAMRTADPRELFHERARVQMGVEVDDHLPSAALTGPCR
jgi:hypothetical protein